MTATIAATAAQPYPTLRPRRREPTWARPALYGLLLATAALYLWGLGASGWANSFYSAAVQAGSHSWKAFFFGSFDSGNFITVDKTPASLWVMDLSARVFGVNAWSVLVPQALEGVAAVALLYATVRRWYGPVAGLLAGAVLAVTPVAVLMFRYNNPDAMLTLLLVAAAYATVRAVEKASTPWLVLAGALVGFGFLAKMLQAFLVLPALAAVYLVAAPTSLRRRIGQLLAAGAATVVAAGWWVAIVQLWPAASRPYIGGSQNNSVLGLAFGYNGFGRLTGNETGSVGGRGGWGITGLTRMFNAEIGGQVSWLLPAALILLAAGLWSVSRRRPRTDRVRAGFLLWGGWLLVTAAVFSLMQGIFHPYYTVALAPAIGALVGMGAVRLWRLRRHRVARGILAATVAVTAIWSAVLLARTADWQAWLRPVIVAAGLATAVVLVMLHRLTARAAAVAAVAAVAVGLAGSAAYAVDTAATPHTGAIPSAGPVSASGPGGRGFGGPRPGGQAFGGGGFRRFAPGQGGFGGTRGGPFGGGFPGGGSTGGGGFARGGFGGLLDARTPSSELVSLLRQNAGSYRWVAATVGANNAAGYQLATGDPVMALGGFNGTDPSPTLPQFQAWVAAGRIHYFIGGGGFRGDNGGTSTSAEIAAWVADNFTASTVGGATVYDLTAPTGTGS